MKVLLTGIAGFIGAHVARALLARRDEVVAVDNVNDYYDVNLKEARLEWVRAAGDYRFERFDLADRDATAALFEDCRPDRVCHLAAQAGVRYSLENPHAYVDANIQAFINVLEGCRHAGVEHLVYASSSSVYGANTRLPFSVHDNIDHPVSLYAASKKANELMAHTYSHLYGVPATGLRFFTVYGPWGRPDMALFLFTRAMLNGEPIKLFNGGHHKRDFTYIDDIVEGVVRSLDRVAEPDPAFDTARPDPGGSAAPYKVYNIGHGDPVDLIVFVEALERKLGVEAVKEYLPLQPGDVVATHADVSELERDIGYRPGTSVETGIGRFVDWYREFYGV